MDFDIKRELGQPAVEIRPPVRLKTELVRRDAPDIRTVLIHKGLMVMLDRAITTPDRIIGTLQIAPERCIGYGFVKQEDLMLRGVDLIEMAAQLLGMWGARFDELFEKRTAFVLAETGAARFYRPVRTGETVAMEISAENIRVKRITTSGRFIIVGRDFAAKVDEEVRANISEIVLISTA